MTPSPKAAHTPVPWKIDRSNRHLEITDMDGGIVIAAYKNCYEEEGTSEIDEDDAAFIVKCVNIHEIMLKALKEVHWLTQGPSLEKQDAVMCQVLEAIAKAEKCV